MPFRPAFVPVAAAVLLVAFWLSLSSSCHGAAIDNEGQASLQHEARPETIESHKFFDYMERLIVEEKARRGWIDKPAGMPGATHKAVEGGGDVNLLEEQARTKTKQAGKCRTMLNTWTALCVFGKDAAASE